MTSTKEECLWLSPIVEPNEVEHLEQISLLLRTDERESAIYEQFAWMLGLVRRMNARHLAEQEKIRE